MEICGNNIGVKGRLVRIGGIAAEGFEFVEKPEEVLKHLREFGKGVDLFTFMQPLPLTSPQYNYPMEWDNLAALPVSTFEHWFSQQIDGKTRNIVRRSEKKGLVVKEVPFDDALVRGISEIYNECPLRQGRVFPHYGKDLETVRTMSATFMESSTFIGAFLDQKLIGFMKLTTDKARSQAAVMHILSMVQHRDKSPMNALISQGVKSCEQRGIPYLVYSRFAYGKKQRDSLSDFKENNGFRRVNLPRYFVPITGLGRIALGLGLHHSLIDYLPESILTKLRDLRTGWLNRKSQPATQSS
jgi:hypothetical protein